MKKTFKVPKSVPLYFGDKRIKLGSGHDMLLWYRRDFVSPIISIKQYEEEIECVAVRAKDPAKWARQRGCLIWLGADKDKAEDYVITMGDMDVIGWKNYKPHTWRIDLDSHPFIYVVVESSMDASIKMIKGK